MPKLKNFKTLQTISCNLLPAPPQLKPGEFLGQKRFEIVKFLGRGGLGSVYLAKDREVHDQLLALKLLSSPPEKKLLIQELKTARCLSHPHIVRIYELYQEENYFLSMEYIKEGNLRAWMMQKERISLEEVSNIILQIGQALQYAHEYMIHCDLKPENILVGNTEKLSLKIADFGISQLKSSESLPDSGILGTFPYMAPELQGGGKATVQSDIYSLGIILYELLMGKWPVGFFPMPSQTQSEIPKHMDEIIKRSLALDPQNRFSNIQEFLQSFLALSGTKKSEENSWHFHVESFVKRTRGFWKFMGYRYLVENIQKIFSEVSEIEIAKYLNEQREKYRKQIENDSSPYFLSRQKKIRENHLLIQSSGLIQQFVVKTHGDPSKQDWDSFWQDIREKHFWPISQKEIEEIVEIEQDYFLKKYQSLMDQLSYLKILEEEGKCEEALDILQYLEDQGVEKKLLKPLLNNFTYKQKQYDHFMKKAKISLAQRNTKSALEIMRQAKKTFPLCFEIEQEISLLEKQLLKEKEEIDKSIQKSLILYSSQKYKEAIHTLLQVSHYKNYRHELLPFLTNFKEEYEKEKEHRHKSLQLWAKTRELSEIIRSDIFKQQVELADFSPGVSKNLAIEYQKDYAKRHKLVSEITVSLPDDTSLKMQLIPPAIFQMGRDVKTIIDYAFYISIYPITQEQWEAVQENPPLIDKGANYPVERVTWQQCINFLMRLNDFTKEEYLLPSEAEWEHACRAGSIDEYWWGKYSEGLEEYAWYSKNSQGHTHPVGEKKANPWGIFDLYGQVWEWCRDWYAPYPSKLLLNPKGPETGTQKVLRGGNVHADGEHCNSLYREGALPNFSNKISGFRIVKILKS